MKLPDFFKFEPLNQAKRRMGMGDNVYGIFSVKIDPGRLTPGEWGRLVDGGIDVELKDVTILPDGTHAYKDSRVLLYIRDVHINGNREWEPRYHLFNCRKLAEMREKGRFDDKYVVSARTDGLFTINVIRENNNKTEDRRLCVCQFCLDGLSFNGFSFQTLKRKERQHFVAEFVPDHFFKIYPRSLHAVKPKHDSDTAPLNAYPPDFSQISERLRRENGWKCQKCHEIFSEPYRRSNLHVHHINGIRSDNTSQNLKVLCAKCHAEEHPHMR